MKKLLSITAFCFLVSLTAKSQQLPLYSQYMMNGFLLNPAMAGTENYMPIVLTARRQWSGFENGPRTIAVSAHTLLTNKKVGVGGYLFNDKFGPISRTGVLASYAYHLKVDKFDSKLALGISASAFQFKLDESELTLIDDEPDAAFTGATETTFMPDANFGAYLYGNNLFGNKYFAGFSVAQLFQFKVNIGNIEAEETNNLIRHYFFTAGYKFKIETYHSKDFEIEPSILLKTTERSPMQIDINAKIYYKKNNWLGISYRPKDAVIILLGYKYDKYYFGYALDITLSNIKKYSSGSHEIMIGYNFGEGKARGARLL